MRLSTLIDRKLRTIRITDVYILPPHRGKGLAKWMMRWIIEESKIRGIRRTQLVSRKPEIALYRKVGFEVLDEPDLTTMEVKGNYN